jgi:hypothetical protein
MKTISVDVDSAERDPSVYPAPNDYTVRLNKRLYGVTKITLTAARIPNCQNLVGSNNRTINVDGVPKLIPIGTFTNGVDLASNVAAGLSGSGVNSVTFNSSTSTLTFSGPSPFTLNFPWGNSPADVLGFTGSNVTGSSITSGKINLQGPSSILLRLTIGGDDLDKDVFINGGTFTFGGVTGLSQSVAQIPPHYIGRIVMGNLGDTRLYNQTDAAISYNVPNLNISDIRIRMYWNNGTKLVPYDFGSRNHMLKFDIVCETDRFNKVYEVEPVDELPPPVEDPDPELEPPRLSNNNVYIIIAAVLFLGLWVLLFTAQSPRTPGAGA